MCGMNKKYIAYILIILVIALGSFYILNGSQYSSVKTDVGRPPSAPSFFTEPATGPAATNLPLTAPGTTQSKTYTVSVVNFSFDPVILNINKGDTVVWTNEDPIPHQIAGKNINGAVMSKGQNYSFVFNDSGTFDYYCKLHPSMKGSVIVK